MSPIWSSLLRSVLWVEANPPSAAQAGAGDRTGGRIAALALRSGGPPRQFDERGQGRCELARRVVLQRDLSSARPPPGWLVWARPQTMTRSVPASRAASIRLAVPSVTNAPHSDMACRSLLPSLALRSRSRTGPDTPAGGHSAPVQCRATPRAPGAAATVSPGGSHAKGDRPWPTCRWTARCGRRDILIRTPEAGSPTAAGLCTTTAEDCRRTGRGGRPG